MLCQKFDYIVALWHILARKELIHMLLENQYHGLRKGDLIQDDNKTDRWHTLYTRPTSRPGEIQVILESPAGNIHDTSFIDGKIVDTDMRTEVPGLNGKNTKLLAEKDAMLA
ncbi:MAG TPA: hypothetical protein VL335_02015 [Candidatus Paceibacterota bacterium]|jgi:hypothetical protein|nr:hypothetical protein [Candidatus Paceibacterota bacterium]